MRLTNDIRDRIVNDILAYRYSEEYNKLIEFNRISVEKIYNFVYDEKTRKLFKQIPEKLLQWKHAFTIADSAGYSLCVRFDGEFGYYIDKFKWFTNPVKINRVAHDDRYHINDKALTDEIFSNYEKIKTLKTESLTTCRAIKEILAKCPTYKILIETWPECEPFAKKYYIDSNKKKVNLPAILPDKINDMLNLPV